MEGHASSCPLRFFSLLPDPRARNVRHRLVDLLVIALMAMICDANGWDDIADFADAKRDWFASFLDLRHGTPSADTFRRVISRLEPDAFEQCFTQWMQAVVTQSKGRLVAVDGKTLRRSFDQGWDKSGMAHLVSAFATRNGQALAQIKTEGKGQELEGIRQLLGLIDLRGATVTIDALGCQKDIAKTITDAGGHYVLAAKENQKALYHRIQVELDDMIRNQFHGVRYDRHNSTELGHGRLEQRTVWVTDELSWLKQARQWAGLRSVAVVESRRQILGQPESVERRYYISSLPADAEALATAIRGHWGIENGLHHILDVTFREDDSRIRKDHGAENVSRLRRMALNLLKARKVDRLTKRKSVRGRRKIAGWDEQFLLRLVTG